MTKRSLTMSRINKKDEFYTLYNDIEDELKHYTEDFKDRVIYCNCDDYRYSNFWRYFKDNFKELRLKKLISTCYIEGGQGIKAEYDGLHANIKELIGDGSFDSKECKEVLEDVDIVVSNPPFSLFKEYISLLSKSDKNFIVIGRQDAIIYKDVFPLLRDGKVWTGYNKGSFVFEVPIEFEKNNTFIEDDRKYAKFGNIVWYTNLNVSKNNSFINLVKEYKTENYYRYLNYDAIDIPSISDIPKDYYGIMGVPFTFMSEYNPEQFEVIGLGVTKLGVSIGVGVNTTDEDFETYKKESNAYRRNTLCYREDNGKLKVPYSRVLVRRVQ